MEENDQRFWEYLNYTLALLGLGVVFFVYRMRSRSQRARYAAWLAPQPHNAGSV
jgi:hypothetical protein